MRYGTLKKTAQRRYCIETLRGGLQMSCAIDTIDNNHLSECVNVWHKEGALACRPAFRAIGEPLCNISSYERTLAGLRFTNAVYRKAGTRYSIAYLVTGDEYSFVKYYIFLINETGERISMGELQFNRTSSDIFYVPESIFFTVGNPTLGAGIYAFVTRRSGRDVMYSVFEADQELDGWTDCQSSFHIPVLYMDGQGTRYGEAKTLLGLSYPSPTSPEQRNLLTGWFKAYYSSDSLSSVFKLPTANLDNAAVNCRIYSDSASYTQWLITAENNSVTQKFLGKDITMRCDRKAGVVSFFEGSVDFSIPIMPYCSSNNIVIRARKDVPNGLASVVSSRRCLSYNSRIYVCDNSINPNEVYSAKLSNPLYFPKGTRAAAGDSTSPVLALGVQSGKIIAFKAGETYRIDISEGASLRDAAIFDESDELLSGDSLGAVSISKSIGCDCPETVLTLGNRLVWANSEGQIFMLATTTYGKENNIYEVSLPLGNSLKATGADALRAAFAVKSNGYYMLFIGNAVWLMFYRVKSFGYSCEYSGEKMPAENTAWYYWETPENVVLTSGMSGNGACLLGAVDNSGIWNYCVALGGERDCVIQSGDIKHIFTESEIVAELATGLLDLGLPEAGKRIDSISIEAYIPHGSIGVFNRNRTYTFDAAPRGQVHRITSVRSFTDKLGVRIVSRGGLRLSSMTFKYRLLSDLR